MVLVGVMSFFADFVYEGSRSIIGPYLGLLEAGALAISIITGLGEFLGYGLRLLTGRAADQTGGTGRLRSLATCSRWRSYRCWHWPAAGR